MNDYLIFNYKPNLKIGDKVREITAENGHFVFHYDNVVIKIEKIETQYKVTLERKN